VLADNVVSDVLLFLFVVGGEIFHGLVNNSIEDRNVL
jgi:hypothetical protein